MLVTLSSKWQLSIPKSVRDAMGLEAGDKLFLEVADHKITLEPVDIDALLDELYGMFEGEDMLSELEREHREEVERDQALYR